MRLRRHRPVPAPLPTSAAVPATLPPPATISVDRLERAVRALAAHAAQIEDRLEGLERRLDSRELPPAGPTHADLDELRRANAALANEVARLSIDLRDEVATAVNRVRRPSDSTNGATSRRRNDARPRPVIDLTGPDPSARRHTAQPWAQKPA